MNPSEVSVIVSSHNALSLLRQTLTSLELQAPDPQAFEVIVVDDGSNDGSAEYLDSYSGPLRLRAICFPTNRGRCAARNAGIAVASRPLTLLIDGDMICPAWLVAGHAALHDESKKVVIGRVTFDRSLGRRGYLRYLESRGAMRNTSRQEIRPRYFLSGHASIPTSLLRTIGGYDEEILHYGADLDVGLRLALAGASFQYEPTLSILHLHVRSLSDTLRVSEEYGRWTLPVIVEKHPDLLDDLRLNWMEGGTMSRVLKQGLLSRPVYRTIRTITGWLDHIWAPSLFYSYLTYRSYWVGYRKACKTEADDATTDSKVQITITANGNHT